MLNRLPLPDKILLQKILKKHLYYDKKSKDPYLDRIKSKYKLAGNCLLDNYFFHVLTTGKDRCKRSCTISLYLSDWENVVSEFEFQLRNVCYCDLTKYEIVSRVGLLKKIKAINNGFPCVGKLCNSKYKKLLKLEKNMHKNPYLSKETKDIIERGISESVDSLLSKLDIR
jgi:hypothetical protein